MDNKILGNCNKLGEALAEDVRESGITGGWDERN